MTITFYTYFMTLALGFVFIVAIIASTTDLFNPRAVYQSAPFAAVANLRTVSYSMRDGSRWVEYEHRTTGRRFALNGKQWRDVFTGRFVSQSIVING